MARSSYSDTFSRSLFPHLALMIALASGCSDDSTDAPPVDTAAPDAITTLAVLDRNEQSVTLTWTAPGDNKSTKATTAYDLRYATEELTAEVWDRATLAVTGPPGEAAMQDTTTVAGLERGTTYYFGIKTVDANHNWSPLSNVAAMQTDVGGPYVRLLPGVPARNPKWSPDGKRIVFSSENEIWTVRADGSDPIQVTTGGGFHPCWSPDGAQIAFVSTRTGRTELWRIPANGGTVYQITNEPSVVYFEHPVWSRDGEIIAFDAYDGFYRDIYTVPAAVGVPEPFTDEPGSDNQPAWSPDGCRLAFRSSRPNSEVPPRVWIDCRLGGAETVVEESDWARSVAWAPDGLRLLLTQYTSGLPLLIQLWWMPTTGGSWVQITREDYGEFIEPDWSPDGTKIVCVHQAPGSPELELWTVGVE